MRNSYENGPLKIGCPDVERIELVKDNFFTFLVYGVYCWKYKIYCDTRNFVRMVGWQQKWESLEVFLFITISQWQRQTEIFV
jgi:hypothetical protein